MKNEQLGASPVQPIIRGGLPRKCLSGLFIALTLFGFADSLKAVQTSLDFYIGEAEWESWTWTVSGPNVSGVSLSGNYEWECGDIIAGSILRSHAGTNLDLLANKNYSVTVTAGSGICDAFAVIWPPFCDDIFINDPLTTHGFEDTTMGYPNWRSGYIRGYTLSSDPNDPRYNTDTFNFNFHISPNTNGEPSMAWVLKNSSGTEFKGLGKNGHFKLPEGGQSTALGTAINTNYMGTNYSDQFMLLDTNNPPTGSYFQYYTNSYTTNFIITVTNSIYYTNMEVITNTIALATNQVLFVAGTNCGTVEVDVLTANPNPCLVTNYFFDVGPCAACSHCLAAQTLNNSVDLRFPLGPTKDGADVSFLEAESSAPSAAMGSPQSLHCNFVHTDLQPIYDSQGWLRQVVALDRIIDITTNSSTSYIVNSYHNSDVLGYSTTNGTYFFTNAPYETVMVSLYGGDTNHVQIQDSAGGGPIYYSDYYWQGNGWKLTTGGGLCSDTKLVYTNGASSYTNVETFADSQGHIAYQTREVWQQYALGPRLLVRTTGSGPMMLTESNTYTADGMLQQANHSDGSWDIYAYDSMDRQIGHYSAFGNSAPTTNSSLCRYTASTYDDSVESGSGDDPGTDPYMPRMVVDYALGSEVGRRYNVMSLGEQQEIQCVTPGAAWNNPSNLVTTTYSFTDAHQFGAPSLIIRPDGTVQVFSYADTANPPNDPGNPSDMDYSKTTVWTGVPSYNWDGSVSVTDGTMDETWTDPYQKDVVHRVTDVASQFIVEQEKYYYDAEGRLTNTINLNRLNNAQTYDCCNLQSSTAPDGTVTSYGYDALKRRILTVQNGITTSNVLDANGEVLATIRYGTDGSVVTNNLSAYTDSGQLISSTDGLGNVTSYTNYFDGSGQHIEVTAYPDSSTRIETYAMDGSLLKVTGTAVLPERYAYGVQSDGGVMRIYKQEIKLDTNGNDTAESTTTYTDMVGRDYKTVYASASGTPASQSIYNSAGQLAQQTDPDGVSTLYQYNAKGQQAYSAVDVNSNGVIDFAGMDRITSTVSDVVSNGYNLLVNRTRTYDWNTANANVSNLVSMSESSVDGLQSWNITYNNGVGLTNYSVTAINPSSGSTTVTSFAPDGSFTVSLSVYGLAQSTTSYDANGNQISQTTFGYDAQGRQNTQTDARSGTSTSEFNAADQVVATLTPSPDGIQAGQLTTNVLDSLGRVIQSILPDNTVVTNVYYTNGLLQATYGSRTYPVAYTYDYAGRMKTMTTWTNFAGSLGAAVTTWNYDGYRGFLTNKAYADGKGPNYTYTPAGRLQTRVWARGTTTTYSYDNAGSLASMNYSDSTPGVGYTFDRLGRQIAVTNGATACAWTYNDVGEPLTETYTGGVLAGLSITNGYDHLLRRTTLSLLSSGSQLLSPTVYGYDAASRLATVTSGTNSATYSYLANSPLVGQITFANNGTVRMTTTKQYDLLNRLTGISSSSSSSSSSFSYNYNTANQRTAVTNTDNSYWVYQYDNLGQVISGKKYWNDGTPVAGQQFTYNFDNIGNRQSTAAGGDASGNNLRTANYSVNSLNQYTTRTVPGYVDVLGSANPNATVTVNLQRAIRKGSYFSDELAVTNTSAPLYLSLTNLAVLNNGTNADIIATNVGNLYVAQTPEVFGYDPDGNQTNSGRWTISWDAENRALSFVTIAGAPLAAQRKVDCAYDWQGRRIQKIVSTNNGSAWVPVYTNRFVYDGWNLIAILSPNSSLLNSFVWGPDLSGSLQTDGGVGGLLAETFYGMGTTNCFVTYDGNGNLATLVNAADGTTTASYEYDPFGQVIRMTGLLAMANPIRFSTKYQDDESGMDYYGYRFYNPNSGRWENRDPSEEDGGLNLYGFLRDASVNTVDVNGMYGRDVHGYFTYFATLAAGADPIKARSIGYYAWGPDATKTLNAITAFTSNPFHVIEIQKQIHALTGESPDLVRDLLDKQFQFLNTDEGFGFWSHTYEDSYAHTVLKRFLLTSILRHFDKKVIYPTGNHTYHPLFGHLFNGTIPDRVSSRPYLFEAMAESYYKYVQMWIGGKSMSLIKYNNYVNAIANVSDARREEFIKYIVRCPGADPTDDNPDFDKILNGLPRLGLDDNNEGFQLPSDNSLKNEPQLKAELETYVIGQ